MSFANLKISGKVMALIALLAGVAVVIALVSAAALGTLNDAMGVMRQTGDNGLHAARLRQTVISLNRAEFSIAAEPTVENFADARKVIEEQRKLMQERMDSLLQSAAAEDSQALAEIERLARNYSAELDGTLRTASTLVGTIELTDAQRRLIEEGRASIAAAEKLESAVRDYANRTRDRAQRQQVEAGATYSRALWIIGIVAAGGIMIGFATAHLVSRESIVKPIRAITACLRRLADGDLGVDVFGTNRRDEIGEIAQATQVFKENMHRNRELERQQEISRAAQLARAASVERLTERFDDDSRRLLDALASAATELEATAQSLSAISEQTTHQSSAASAASVQAAANVQTVAAASEELAASIKEIGRQTNHSRSIARTATTHSQKANELVGGLDTASRRIGEVIALISGIAGQTNLLALNATIEAARAGEAGKGFAVVASEVKALANQTARATDDISAQVAAVQKVAAETAASISDITGIVAEMDQVSTSVAGAVEQQSAATQEIGRNVGEAARGTDEVSRNMQGIQGAAEGTSSAATQVLAAARELSREAETLRNEVRRFLDEVKAA